MKVPTVLERVQKLEQEMREAERLGSLVGNLRQTIGEVIEVVQAILAEQGEDFEKKIEGRMQAKRDAVRRERDKRAADAVNQMVETGVLTATDVVEDDTLVVGREFDANGELTSDRVQAVFSMFAESVRNGIKGQGVGAVYETPQGKFEVLEIYKFVKPTLPTEEAPADALEILPPPAPAEETAPATTPEL